MSNQSFDTVEMTLKSLKDIVDRNHSESVEASQLVEDMELLIAEMKTKTRNELKFNKVIDATTIVIHSTPVVTMSL